MNLKEQQYVCTLARCQTISKASEELFISQPSLSVYISNLEKTLGVKLFDRSSKRFVLTKMGKEYVSRAEKMLEMKAEFDRLVAQTKGEAIGRISIGIQQRRAIIAAPKILLRFAREYPNVKLVLRDGNYDEISKMYISHEIDGMIGPFRNVFPETECVPVIDEYILAAVPEGHPANQKAHETGGLYPWINLKELEGETFILTPEHQSMRLSAERLFQEAGIRPREIVTAGNFELIMGMVENGMGIAFNRIGYINTMNHYTKVRYYLVGEPPATSELVIRLRRNLSDSIPEDCKNCLIEILTDEICRECCPDMI